MKKRFGDWLDASDWGVVFLAAMAGICATAFFAVAIVIPVGGWALLPILFPDEGRWFYNVVELAIIASEGYIIWRIMRWIG